MPPRPENARKCRRGWWDAISSALFFHHIQLPHGKHDAFFSPKRVKVDLITNNRLWSIHYWNARLVQEGQLQSGPDQKPSCAFEKRVRALPCPASPASPIAMATHVDLCPNLKTFLSLYWHLSPPLLLAFGYTFLRILFASFFLFFSSHCFRIKVSESVNKKKKKE
jgi:hypothetical protein